MFPPWNGDQTIDIWEVRKKMFKKCKKYFNPNIKVYTKKLENETFVLINGHPVKSIKITENKY